MTKDKQQKIDVDKIIIERLGLEDMDESTKREALTKIGQTLQIEVGSRIANQLSEKQLAEFEKLADKDDDIAQKWLTDNVSNYGDIVVEELAKLLDDYDSTVDQIMAA